jgi:hypothetical protein
MAAVLRNFSWMDADSLMVFVSEAFYRRKGDVRGCLGGPHHGLTRPRGHPCHQVVWPPRCCNIPSFSNSNSACIHTHLCIFKINFEKKFKTRRLLFLK